MRSKKTFFGTVLGSRRGESIVETLVAILIATLSLGLLAMVVVSSSRITSQSADAMKDYHDANSLVSAHDSTKVCGTGTLTLKEDGTTLRFTADSPEEYHVTYYKNDESGNVPVVAYELNP